MLSREARLIPPSGAGAKATVREGPGRSTRGDVSQHSGSLDSRAGGKGSPRDVGEDVVAKPYVCPAPISDGPSVGPLRAFSGGGYPRSGCPQEIPVPSRGADASLAGVGPHPSLTDAGGFPGLFPLSQSLSSQPVSASLSSFPFLLAPYKGWGCPLGL